MSGLLRRVALPSAVLAFALASGGMGAALADTTSPSASPAAGASASGDKKVLTIGVTQDLDSANPFTGLSSVAYEIFQMQYPTLTQYSAEDFGIVPGLADSWQEAPDKKSWTYTIHPGITWSDGTPLTAKDAAYTLNRVINGEYEKTNYGSYTENMVKAEAVDDLTLKVTVKKPSPVMEHLYVFILPEHIWKSIDEKAVTNFKNEGTPASPSVGSGSFFMVERKVGQFIRMQANPNFWRGAPGVDEIVFKIFQNSDALGQALKKGEIDFAEGLETNVFNSIKDTPGITGVSAPYAGFNEVAFNTGAALADGTPIGDGNPLLKDVKLRRALTQAIDRDAMVAKILGGEGTSGSTVVPPLYSLWHVDPANPLAYDPAQAAAALDAAGYKVGPDGIRADAAGNKLSFRLLARSDNPLSPKAAQFIKGYLNAVGVEVTVKPVSEDALYEIVGKGEYDMFEWGWGVEPDPNYMLSTFTCANRSYKQDGTIYANLSDSFYCNPAYDALFAQQSVETDRAKRTEIVKQMQQLLYDDAPYVVTYYTKNHEAYRSDRFEGFVPQPSGDGTLIYQWGAWSYEKVRPVSQASASPSDGGTATGGTDTASGSTTTTGTGGSSSGMSPAVIAGIVGGVTAALVATWALRRRNSSSASDDRE